LRHRSIRFGKMRRSRKAVPELDITSLLDILVIMLVFLLHSYNSSGIILNVPKGIQLPKSASQAPNNAGVIVQVSPQKIWVDDQIILDLNKLPSRTYDHGGRRIIPLFNELTRKKEMAKRIKKGSDKAKPFSGVINFVIDKTLKYNYLKRLMYTAAEAGYKQYKFVVLGENF
jgi:biopolymer transport protein ExbD